MHLTYAARTRQGIKYIRFREEDVMGAKRETWGCTTPPPLRPADFFEGGNLLC